MCHVLETLWSKKWESVGCGDRFVGPMGGVWFKRFFSFISFISLMEGLVQAGWDPPDSIP